ncbi:MAG: hypothetical protein KA436_08355 [Oligoflexales bacterium]|nr:hypothetical protein [Oligoflexales bacterium]
MGQAQKNIPKSLGAQVESLKDDIEKDFLDILRSELDELTQLSRFTESIRNRLNKLYADYFPKKCSSCGTFYKTREEFIEKTLSLNGKSVIVDEHGVQEYRNCSCGSTLLLWTDDRRDMSEFGRSRRRFFETCLSKLTKITFAPEEELKEKLRKIFYTVGM